MLGSVVVFFLTLKVGASRLGFNFFETTDRGRIFIRADFPSYYNLEKTVSRLEGIQARLMDLPDLTHILTTAGKAEAFGGQPNEGVYLGQIEIFFKPKTERDWKILDVLSDIRAMLATETDCLLSASVQSGMGGGQSFAINYNLTGEIDILEAPPTSQEVARDAGRGQLTDRPRRKPEIRVVPRRVILADLSIPAMRLGTTCVPTSRYRGRQLQARRPHLRYPRQTMGNPARSDPRQALRAPMSADTARCRGRCQDSRSTIQIFRVKRRMSRFWATSCRARP